jgi:hypothetical protein
MTTDTTAIFTAALALPEPLRADLAALLMDSLDEQTDATQVPEHLMQLINERCDEVARDEAEIMTGEEAIARLREIAGAAVAKP